MIIVTSFIIFISNVIEYNNIIITIISVTFGVLSFFLGFFYYRYKSAHYIKNIFIKFKEYNINQKQHGSGSQETVNKSVSDVTDNERLSKSSGSISKKSGSTEIKESENNSISDEEEEKEDDIESSSISESEYSEDIRLINKKLKSKIKSFESIDKICKLIMNVEMFKYINYAYSIYFMKID